MAYTQQQIDSLKKIQTQLKTPEAFNSYVTKTYGVDRLNEIKTNLQGSVDAGMKLSPTITAKNNIDQAKVDAINIKNNPSSGNSTIPPVGEGSYIPGATPISTGPTINVSGVTTSEQASNVVTGQIKENVNTTTQQATDYTNAQNIRTEEDKKVAKDKIQQEKDFAKKQQDLIANYDKQIADLQAQQKETNDQRLTRDVDNMNAQKQKDLDKAQAQADLQKFNDEQVIKDRAIQADVDVQKSAWAFNRMGAGFSSAAIATTSKIASDGATAVAGLKLQAGYNQADIASKVGQLSLEYTKEINSTIDKYTDANVKLDEDVKTRISNTQNNLLLSEKQKNDAINTTTDEYLKQKRAHEDAIYTEMERLRNNQIVQAKELQQQITAQENTQKEKVNSQISSGQWSTLTSEQKVALASKSGISVQEIEASQANEINTQSLKLMQSQIGSGFIPSLSESNEIQSESRRLMTMGYTMEQAVQIVTNRIIKANPTYKASLVSKSSSGGTKSISTSSMKQGSDGFWYAWNGTDWAKTSLEGKTTSTGTPNQFQLPNGTVVERGEDDIYRPALQETAVEVASGVNPDGTPSGKNKYENIIGPLKASKVGVNKQETPAGIIPSFNEIQ